MSPPGRGAGSGAEMVRVKVGEYEVPFSRGILAKSITSAGVNVDEAYELTSAILGELTKGEVVPADQLREMAYQKLLTAGHARAARNYLVWSQAHSLDRSIIVLVGGATGVGKSTITSEVGFRLGIRTIIGTDTIREVMRRIVSPQLLPTLHTSTFEAHTTLQPPTRSIDKVVYAFENQVAYVGVGINAVVERAHVEGVNTIIDGVHIVPGHIDIDVSANVFQFVLWIEDEQQHKGHFYARSVGTKRPPRRYIREIANIRRIQDFILEKAHEHDVPTIENSNLDRTITEILDTVTDRLTGELKK